MNNLKRVLSLGMAGAMLSGLAITASAADFVDADKITHNEAVDTLVTLDIVGGKENNNFDPEGTVTRAEMAKMITVALNGGKVPVLGTKVEPTFTDIKDHWAESFIEYCYNLKIIGGRGDGTFAPDDKVTGTEAAKMMLTAIGYDAGVQGYSGNDWALSVNRDANTAGLYEDLRNINPGDAMNRDNAAQLIYNGIQADMMEKTPSKVVSSGEVTYSYELVDKDILSEKYGMKTVKGHLALADYNADTKKFQYTIDPETVGFTPVAGPAKETAVVAYSTENNTDMMGYKVQMLYRYNEKTEENEIYGFTMLSDVFTATVGELDKQDNGDKKVKLAGTEYKLEVNDTATPVWVYEDEAMIQDAAFDTLDEVKNVNIDNASDVTLVDEDRNGKIDYVVVLPASVEKITYVSNKSITAGTSYKFEDHNIYEDAAKNDFVKIVDAKNSVFGKATITKVEAIEGVISAMKGTDVQIDGDWYSMAKNDGDVAHLGDTVALTVVGDYYYDVKIIDGKTLDNVLMVLDAGKFDEGLASGAEAKVMYAKDGSVDTVRVSKTNDSAINTVNTVADGAVYNTAGHLVKGAMYTFKEKDGSLELTTLADDVIGISNFVATAASYDDDSFNGEAGVGGKAIADDAVIMVYTTNNGDGKSAHAYITGAELKTWGTSGAVWGVGDSLSKTVNGVDTVFAAALYGDSQIPGVTGNIGYGYVTDTTYAVKEGNDTFAVMTIWTDEGEMTEVKAESDNAGATITAAKVKAQAEFKKGSFVTFKKLPSGNISDVTVIGDTYAVTGMYINKDNNTLVNLEPDAIAGVDTETYTINKDTKIIYVDTANKAGAEGGALELAIETAIDGVYVKNVVAAANASDEALVVFVDVNNNLASNDGLKAFAAQANLKNADKGQLFVDTEVANDTVVAQAMTAFGALSVQVNDKNEDNTANIGETVTVVAADGNVVVYTIAQYVAPAPVV